MVPETNNRNFGLTEAQFLLLAEKLRQGDESLFEQLFLKQFKSARLILTRKYNTPHEEAYDCVMWAMLRMRQMILEAKVSYGNLESYLIKIAVNKHLKNLERNKEFSTEFMPESALLPDEADTEEALQILESAWKKMGDKCQMILKSFYYDKIELKQLTLLMEDSSEANTRKRKERCLKELRNLFFQHDQ